MSLQDWMVLNQGIEHAGGDVPMEVQKRIYAIVATRRLWQLDLAEPDGRHPHIEGICRSTDVNCKAEHQHHEDIARWLRAELLDGGAPKPEESVGEIDKRTPLASCADLEGWVQVLACGDIHSTSARCELDDDNISSDGRRSLDTGEESSIGPLADGLMWASLCCDLLFLSAGENRAPHALLDLRKLQIGNVDSD